MFCKYWKIKKNKKFGMRNRAVIAKSYLSMIWKIFLSSFSLPNLYFRLMEMVFELDLATFFSWEREVKYSRFTFMWVVELTGDFMRLLNLKWTPCSNQKPFCFLSFDFLFHTAAISWTLKALPYINKLADIFGWGSMRKVLLQNKRPLEANIKWVIRENEKPH